MRNNFLIRNMPNLLTLSRIFLTFVIMYMLFNNYNILIIVSVFAVAALTDLLDGKIARKYKFESEFGRKADMLADRFLWIGTALAFLISLILQNKLDWYHAAQLSAIMLREILTIPVVIFCFFYGGTIFPNARYIAKVTTFIQGFALPSLILSVYYPIFSLISIPLSIAAAVTGFFSANYYVKDIKKQN